MRILNQTAYPDEWLRERVEFGLAGAHPKVVRVMYLPSPTWPRDGKHIAGKTLGLLAGGGRYPGNSRVDVYLPHRLRHVRIRHQGVSGLGLGRWQDADGLVFIVAHEAEHVCQINRPRTARERRCKNQERAADIAGVERLRAWHKRGRMKG